MAAYGSIVVAVLAVIAIAVVAVVAYLAYSWDSRQRAARTRQHRDAGGRPGEEPDAIPPHGGGSGAV